MQTRWSAYAGVSAALAGGVVVKALAQRPNFYSAAVYLSQSSANLMILTNMAFVTVCTVLLGLQKLLYGPLRPIEIEQLYEKAWFAVTETCLAMTIFRDDIGAWFLVMFFALLAGKVWAWIGEGRVEILEQQPPRDPRLFHTRLALSLGLSVAFNLSMLEFVVTEVMHMPKPDMMVMFGFEFAVLSIVSLSTAARYAINLAEIAIVRKQKTKRIEEIRKDRREAAIRVVLDRALAHQRNDSDEDATQQPNTNAGGAVASLPTDAMDAAREADRQPVDEAEVEVVGWEEKGRWVFYLDLATDFLKLVVYLSFFFILLTFYGLPIHILRDVFMTCRSFIKRISDFLKYRNATRDMNERYPDATEQDFRREDVCIICFEEMRPYEPPAQGQGPNPVAERMRPKKLPCGHVLHFSCLRSWLERQQICPTCRTSVVTTNQDRTAQGGPGNAQGAANHPPPAAGGNGGRGGVIRLGPLRIAVGAAQGNNIMGDLQQRLRDGEGAAAQPPVNNNAPRQYGFGIRWDGMRRRERRNQSHRSIQDQLSSLERQLQQEVNSLGANMAELQVLRGMEAQLAHLRRRREAGTQPPSAGRSGGNNPVTAGHTVPAQLVGDVTGQMGPGHPGLPAGLTLPDGWSMTPLVPAYAHGQVPPFPVSVVHGPGGFSAIPTPFAMPGRMMPFGGQFPIPQPHPLQQHQQHAQEVVNGAFDDAVQQQAQVQQTQQSTNPAEVPVVRPDPTPTQTLADTMEAISNSRGDSHTADQSQATNNSPRSSSNIENGSSRLNATNTQITGHDHPATASDAATTGSVTIPPLPRWGSESVDAANSSSTPPASATAVGNGTASEVKDTDEHDAPHSTAFQQNSPRLDGDSASSSSARSRKPTVEDLVEDPD